MGTSLFKNESIKYCKLDCKALHEVLSAFNKLIFEQFKVRMGRYKYHLLKYHDLVSFPFLDVCY